MDRIFFAIPLSDEIKRIMETVQKSMKGMPGKIKWVEPEKIHLTIKFVGDTDTEKVESLYKAVDKLSLPQPFQITLSETGMFPGPGRPRILWVGIQESQSLQSIAKQVDDKFTIHGIKKEKRDFHPHLTVGRVKGRGLPDETVKTFLNINVPNETMQVDSIVCYRSDLTPQGAEYTALHTTQLS